MQTSEESKHSSHSKSASIQPSADIFEDILETVSEGVMIVNKEGSIIHFNKKFSSIWELPENLCKPENHADITGYVAQQLNEPMIFLSRIESIRELPNAVSFDLLEGKNGTILEVYTQPLMIEGIYGGRIWNFRDMTDRQIAFEKLRKAKDQFKLIINTAQEGIWVLDENNITSFVNKKMAEMLEYSIEEMKGKPDKAFLDADGQLNYENLLQQRKLGIHKKMELGLISKSGKHFWANFSFSPIVDHDGHIRGSLSMVTDINKRKSAEEALKQSELKFSHAFNHAPIGIGLLSPEGHFLKVNKVLCRLVGYDEKDLLQMKFQDITHPEDLHDDLENVNLLLQGSINAYQMEKRYLHKSGNIITVLLDVSLVCNDRQEPLYFISQIQDITEKKRLEEKVEIEKINRQREIARAVIESQEHERSEIGRELHDNVNQLLGTIRLYIDMAMNAKDEINPLLETALEYTHSAIEENRKLSKRMITPRINNLGFAETVQDMADDIMKAHPVKICFSSKYFDENNYQEKFKVNLFRMIQEQVNNILKHANATRIKINILQTDTHLYTSIIDNGIGFDINTKKKGMGIANINNRSSLYNGVVTFITAPGQGCELNLAFLKNGSILALAA